MRNDTWAVDSCWELFVDGAVIESLTGGAQLRLNHPAPQEIVFECGRPWEGNTSGYFTVLQDGKTFRMYYRGSGYDVTEKRETHPEVTCVAESSDGIHWERPNIGLYEFNGSKRNNIVWTGRESHNFAPFVDENPDTRRMQRYKAMASVEVPDNEWGALGALVSPDGTRNNAPAWGLLVTRSALPGCPDEISFYSVEGYYLPNQTARVRRFTLRMDGFVSVNAPYSGGEVLTKLLTLQGERLQINYATSAVGSVKVEVTDLQGNPVKGFTADDCVEMFGDELEADVRWKNADIRALRGKPVRLRFLLRDADLYAFRCA